MLANIHIIHIRQYSYYSYSFRSPIAGSNNSGIQEYSRNQVVPEGRWLTHVRHARDSPRHRVRRYAATPIGCPAYLQISPKNDKLRTRLHLTFSMPHNKGKFLPPLLSPGGQEVSFLYTPHISLALETCRPRYGAQGLGEILTQQYPPIFHAATNVPAFIRAFECMPKLRHLAVAP